MEIGLGVLGSLLGVSYAFNKNGIQREKKTSGNVQVPANNIPTGTNIYNSNKTVDIWRQEQDMMNKMYEKARHPEANNVVVPGPPLPQYRKVDYQNEQLPITYRTTPQEPGFVEEARKIAMAKEHDMLDRGDGGGYGGTDKPVNDMSWVGGGNMASTGGWVGTSLSGNPIDEKNFRHRNMTPFFGSTVKQNVDQYANQTRLEHFTGNAPNYREKKETSPLFKPQRDVGNPYGMSNLAGYNYDRFIVGNKRNNETPVEKVYVGPGLNKGYTAQPSGGFQQANTRDYVLPKTVDELRAKTNPKLSYYGRIIAGKHISRPGKIGLVQRNRPDSFFLNTPDRWFTTTGAREKAKIRPYTVVKSVNRKTTGLKSSVGPAGPAVVKRALVNSKIRVKDNRQQLSNGGWRNLKGDNAGVGDKSDYGKEGYQVKPQSRSCTGHTNYKGIAKDPGGGQGEVRSNSRPRPSRRQNYIGSARAMGNPDGQTNRKGWVRNPNDVARTTTKQTTVDDGYVGGVGGGQNNKKGWVRNPNDVARTTVKETTIDDDYVGGVGGGQNNKKGWVRNPNDVARTTVKETTIDDDYVGGVSGGQNNRKGYVHDPEDVAKATTKQTTIDDGYVGAVSGEQNTRKGWVRDPNDVAKTTIKETTYVENYVGGTDGQNTNDGYRLVKANAKPTNRQTTTRSHAGGANKPREGAYSRMRVKAPNTNRQFTSDVQYFGVGDSDSKKPRMMDDINNAQTRTHREQVAQGRAPTRQSQKIAIGAEGINLTKVRDTETENQELRERGIFGKGPAAIPDKEGMGNVTNHKTQLNSGIATDRLDSGILDQLKDNDLALPPMAKPGKK